MSNRPKKFSNNAPSVKEARETGNFNKKLKKFGLYLFVGLLIFWFLIWMQMLV